MSEETTQKLRETLADVLADYFNDLKLMKERKLPLPTLNYLEVLLTRVIDATNNGNAAALRNCDVGTADEQAKRHAAYCSRSRSCFHSGCIRKCFAEWSQMPYTEGSAK